jgi:hypothetical protein
VDIFDSPFFILEANQTCAPGTEITTASRCTEVSNWKAQLGIRPVRPVYVKDDWKSVPFQCSYQVEGDETIHFNRNPKSNNKRLTSGEFLMICDKGYKLFLLMALSR